MGENPTRTPRRRYVVYLLLFVMCTLNYGDRAALSVGVPYIRREFDLGPIEVGWLLSAFIWTYFLFNLPTALAVDRWGTRRIGAIAVAAWSLAMVLTGTAWSFVSLFGMRLLLGLGEAPSFPVGHRAIREWAPAGERGLAATLFSTGVLTGVSFGALASSLLIAAFGWRVTFVALGVSGFGWVAAWLLLFRDPAQTSWIGAEERSRILVERQLDPAPQARRLSVAALLRQRSTWGLIVAQVCGNFTNFLLLTWLPTYLNTARHIAILDSGLYTALCYGIAGVGTVAAGAASDFLLGRMRGEVGARRRFVALPLFVAGVMAFAPFVSSHALLLALLTFSLICMQTSLANNQALANDLLADGRAIGTLIGLIFAFSNGFGIIAPIATGFIVARTGSFTGAFELAAVLMVIGAAAALGWTRQPIRSPGVPS